MAGLPFPSLSTSPKSRPQLHFFLQQRPCWLREELHRVLGGQERCPWQIASFSQATRPANLCAYTLRPKHAVHTHACADTHMQACAHTFTLKYTLPDACLAPHSSDQRLRSSVPMQAHSLAGRRAHSFLDESVHGIPGFEGSSPLSFYSILSACRMPGTLCQVVPVSSELGVQGSWNTA